MSESYTPEMRERAQQAYFDSFAMKKKRHKFHAVRTEVDGITFSSKKEAKRYQELLLLKRAGEISGLQIQPRFSIDIDGKHICNVVLDFSYQNKNGAFVYEDTKGLDTPISKLKRKLVEAIYKIKVEVL